MALRFLADHCISNSIVKVLRDEAHELMRLRDVLPVESPDAIVIAKAQELDAILLSLNGDFADIVTYPPKNYKGIVALQMRNHSSGPANGTVRRIFRRPAYDGTLSGQVASGRSQPYTHSGVMHQFWDRRGFFRRPPVGAQGAGAAAMADLHHTSCFAALFLLAVILLTYGSSAV